MLPRDNESLAEVLSFAECCERLADECQCAQEFVEDAKGHQHDAKGLFARTSSSATPAAHRGKGHGMEKGLHPAHRPGKPDVFPQRHPGEHRHPPAAQVRKEQRKERQELYQKKMLQLEHHEHRLGERLEKAAETLDSAQEMIDAAHAIHGDVADAAGTLIDFAALSVPHIKAFAMKYQRHLQHRFGAHGAKVIMASGSAIALGIRLGIPGGNFVPLSNYLGSLPAVALAELCLIVQACGKAGRAVENIVQKASKIPGISHVAKGVSKVAGAYQHGRAKLERGARHLIGRGARGLGRGIAAAYHKVTGHAEGDEPDDDDPEGVLDEPPLDDATVQHEAEKFAASILKQWKGLLDQHKDKLEAAGQTLQRGLQK